MEKVCIEGNPGTMPIIFFVCHPCKRIHTETAVMHSCLAKTPTHVFPQCHAYGSEKYWNLKGAKQRVLNDLSRIRHYCGRMILLFPYTPFPPLPKARYHSFTVFAGKGGNRVGEEQIIWPQERLVLYKSSSTLWNKECRTTERTLCWNFRPIYEC